MAGLVTTFMTATALVTTASVHQELGPVLDLLKNPNVSKLVVMSTSDIPDKDDGPLEKFTKRVGLTRAFKEAGVDPSNLSTALKVAEAIADKDYESGAKLIDGQAYYLGLKSAATDDNEPAISGFSEQETTFLDDLKTGIILYNPDHDDHFFEGVCGWHGASAKYIPGNDTDIKAIIFGHEAGHGLVGHEEYMADRYSFQRNIDSGKFNLDTLHAFRGCRTLFEMNSNPSITLSDRHDLASMNNFPWEKDQERLPDDLSAKEYKAAIKSVSGTLYELIGKGFEDGMTKLDALDHFPSNIVNDAEKTRIALTFTPEQEKEALDSTHMSERQKGYYYDFLKQQNITKGFLEGKKDPELVYNAALQILSQIRKQGDQTQIVFLERFIDAAQRYQPELFGVQEADRKSNTPVSDRGITLVSAAPAVAPAPARNNP